MAYSTSDAIFLGNFADADTDEATFAAEDTSIYAQDFGSAGAPLHENVVSVTYTDDNQDGGIVTDNNGTEQISYDLGTGSTTSLIDSLALVSGTVTYVDGTTQTFSNGVMYQDTNGNLFLTNSDFAGTDLNSVSGSRIQSVDINDSVDTNWSGLMQNNLREFVCYLAGTLIRTPDGDRPIETLRVGDLVTTQDRGPQPIRWIGDRTVPRSAKMTPVRIAQGALGKGLPSRDLLVSQQHRILMRSRIVERMIGEAETFIAAKKLVGITGISLDEGHADVRYIHFMCDHHEVIFAEGAPSESLLPAPVALATLGHEAQAEVLEIFPELAQPDCAVTPARHVVKGAKQRKLLERHAKNHRDLVSGAPQTVHHAA